MRIAITAMSLVLAGVLCTASAQSQTEVRPGKPKASTGAVRPRVEIEKMDIYVCPRHPEAKATWPARCPMCEARMRRWQSGGGPGPISTKGMMKSPTAGMSPQMRMRHQMMMNTPIHVYDPETLLGSRKTLGLSQEQVQELRTIAMKARRGAMAVLTDAQRRRLMPLERMTGFPLTMTQMRQKMMQQMSSGRAMTGSSGMSGMGQRKDPPALEQQGRVEYQDYYPGSAQERLIDEDEGFGDEEGLGAEGEGFGDDEGFGDEEGLGNDDEGFGFGDGLGNDEEFGNNDESGGEEGFGNNEGFGDNEGFDNEERFGGNGGFRGNEGFRGGERFGNEERIGPRSRGR